VTTPRISVLLPVCNAQRYVEQAVLSILAQTYADLELIAIDDGSDDASIEVLRRLQASDKRLIVVSRERRGLAQTLNQGMDMARGEWLARMDADDVALAHRLARQLQCLKETGADLCGSWIQLFGTSDRRVIRHPHTDAAIKAEMLFGSPFAHPTVVMRTTLARQLGYDASWEKCEDYDLWERAARAQWRMANVQEALVSYRQHGEQISTGAAARQQRLTQAIRRRYWQFVFDALHLEARWMDAVLALREPAPGAPDMNAVDAAFQALLANSTGEAQVTIFNHATRLYFRAAGRCPDIVSRWARLNRAYGTDSGLKMKMGLWLLRSLRLAPESTLFEKIKQLYFSLSKTT